MNKPMQLNPRNLKSQQRRWRALFAALALTLLAHGPTAFAQNGPPTLVPIAVSDFDDPAASADGWQGTNNINGRETLSYYASGGFSGGGIAVSENAGDSALMFFAAPAKFLGNQRSAYNGLLRFSLKQSATGSWAVGNDIRFQSGALMLAYRLPKLPGLTWETFDVPLNENVGWLNMGTGQLASREEIITVLTRLDTLWIRAEYSSVNADRADLDNVMLLAQPSGPPTPELTLRSYAGLTINGAVGSSYRIEYRTALGDGDAWQKLTDVILSTSPYLFVDNESPSTSVRFYRAVLNQ